MELWLRRLRRLRGMFGIGILWGVAGTALGATAAFVAKVFFGGLPPGDFIVDWILGAGGLGFLLGCGFAGVLMTLERRRALDELPPGRAAAWGAMAGAALPLAWVLLFLATGGPAFALASNWIVLLAASGSYAALSAALAAGTVSLARRAPKELAPGSTLDESELLEASVEEHELT